MIRRVGLLPWSSSRRSTLPSRGPLHAPFSRSTSKLQTLLRRNPVPYPLGWSLLHPRWILLDPRWILLDPRRILLDPRRILLPPRIARRSTGSPLPIPLTSQKFVSFATFPRRCQSRRCKVSSQREILTPTAAGSSRPSGRKNSRVQRNLFTSSCPTRSLLTSLLGICTAWPV